MAEPRQGRRICASHRGRPLPHCRALLRHDRPASLPARRGRSRPPAQATICVSVAGALEIPAGMAIALDAAKAAGRPYDGAIALGCVVRLPARSTSEIVAGESARALMNMSVTRKPALGNGILTTDTLGQATRSAPIPERGDKGNERPGPPARPRGISAPARPAMSIERRSAARAGAGRRSTRWRSPETENLPDVAADFEAALDRPRDREGRIPRQAVFFGTWSPASCATRRRSAMTSTARWPRAGRSSGSKR